MWPDVFTINQFFEAVLCDAIVSEMKAIEGSAATVYGRNTSGSIDTNVRNTLRVVPSSETVALVTRRLLSCKSAVEKHFSVSLGECEAPQFLRYREGDFFVAHGGGSLVFSSGTGEASDQRSFA